MKIFTHYSDSHRELFENYFLKSLKEIGHDTTNDLVVNFHEQKTKVGAFMEEGWLDTMDIKLQTIQDALESEDIFIFSDVDVQFFAPFVADIEQQLTHFDFVAQEDRGTLCAGFFGCKSTRKTKELFRSVRMHFRSMKNDQVALNNLIGSVKHKLLDKGEYYTSGNFFNNPNGTHVWDNRTVLKPPRHLRMHHANYVIGTQNKLELLKMIRQQYDASSFLDE